MQIEAGFDEEIAAAVDFAENCCYFVAEIVDYFVVQQQNSIKICKN